MFNVGAGEIVLILVVALIILGPQRLPELARGLGKFMREFRRQTDEVRGTLEREFYKMDQEIAREEPPRRLAEPAVAPPPAASPETFPLSSLPPPPLEPLPPDAATAEPVQQHAPLGVGPTPLDPSVARTQTLEALTPEAAAATLAEPTVPPAEPQDPEALPQLPPVPGTVSRNALKRPAAPSPDEA